MKNKLKLIPRKSDINKELNKWTKKREYTIQEEILKNLFRKYPKNTNLDEIKVKIKTLNLYYSTHMPLTDEMAERITKIKNIDKKLQNGDIEVVKKIANKLKKRARYSFATKYCSFHNPKKFPIYDTFVRKFIAKFYKENKEDLNEKLGNTKINEKILREYKNYKIYKKLIDIFIKNSPNSIKDYKSFDRYVWTQEKYK